MYSFLIRKGPLMAFLLALACIVIGVIPILGGASALGMLPVKEQAFAPEGGIFYTILYLTAILFVAAVAAAILLSLFKVATNPKASSKGLIAFGLLLVLFLIFYALSSAEATGSLKQTIDTFGISSGVSQFIGGAIRLTLTLGTAAIAIMVILEIWNYFKTQ